MVDIAKGMTVQDAAGTPIGTVTDVWPDIPEEWGTGRGYFAVRHGGIAGLGGQTLWIPFSAVTGVDDKMVGISCTAAECVQRFAGQPHELHGDWNAPEGPPLSGRDES